MIINRSMRSLRVLLALVASTAFVVVIGRNSAASAQSPTVFSENGSTFVVDQLSASDVSPDPPDDLDPTPPGSSGIDPDDSLDYGGLSSSASGTCIGSGSVSGHAYSQGFTTCGSAVGLYGSWTPRSTPSWHVDTCCTDSHINPTFWFSYFTSSGAYQGLEVGYWRARSGAPQNQCFYAGTFIGATYTGHCLQHIGASPPSTTFWIEASSHNSSSFRVYVHDHYYATYTLGVNVSHRLNAGYEEQADSLTTGQSSNISPVGNFDSLIYKKQSDDNWYDWGSHSHCQVNYNKSESFGSSTFATSFVADIGTSAGSYAGCDGAAPVSPRSSW